MERRGGRNAIARLSGDQIQTFYDFVNRVALLCQTEVGGPPVSACTVLQTFSKVIYLFTSNCREDFELEYVARKVELILRMVSSHHETEVGRDSTLRNKILRNILVLVRPRVEKYLNKLVEHLEECIKGCEREDNERGITVVKTKLGSCYIIC